jgi:two-component system OmpR family response regulator
LISGELCDLIGMGEMKVLIIDDEEDTRSICSMSLGLIDGAQVVEAASGSDGLIVAAQEQPDVIILDLLMPGMDGAETLRNLRRNPETEKIPVIFLTTKGMFDEFDGLKSLGALAVIPKPFDPVRIGSQIQQILQKAQPGSASSTEASQ